LAFKKRPRTVLSTEKFAHRLKIDLAFKASVVAAAVLALVTLLNVNSMILDAVDAFTTARTLEASIRVENQSLATLRQRTRDFETPMDEVVTVTQTDEALAKGEVDPTRIMRVVAAAMDPSIKVQKITYSALSPPLPALVVNQPPAGAQRTPAKSSEFAYELRFTVRFIGDWAQQADQAAIRAKEFKERMSQALPDHEVSILQLPLSQLRSQVLEGSAGAGKKTMGPVTADYLIRKRV
jgi:hypothetical protein